MFFIRHSQLFNRRGFEERCLLSNKRSEGRLKRYESCTDTRAWSLDRRERASYVMDFMSSIARADQLVEEKALEGTSSQGKDKGKVLEDIFSPRKDKGKALGGTHSLRKASPSEYEYTSEAIEHAGALHGEGVGVDLRSGNLPSDMSESSLYGGKFAHIAALEPNPDGGFGYGSKEELLNFSKENTSYGEHSGISLRHAGIKTERKSDDAIQSENQFEETIRDEDETLPLDHIKQESLEDSTLNDVSEFSLNGGKFTQFAALRPNPDGGCGCGTKNEFLDISQENTSYGEHSGVSLRHADIKAEKKSDDAIQSKNQFEETFRDEDETLPVDRIKQESLEDSTLNDVSEFSLNGGKFTQFAALRPNPDGGCGCGTKKELLDVSKENTSGGEHTGVSLQQADIMAEKKSENLFEQTTRIEDETIPLDHIKQESFEETTLNDISKFSSHGGKFTQFAALQPNPEGCCGYSPQKELLNFSTETEHNGVSLQCADINSETKSENLFEQTTRIEDETLPLDHIKQESFEESILNDVSQSSLKGGKFTQIAALRPNPARNCVCSAAKELLTTSKETNFYTVSLHTANVIDDKKSSGTSTKGNTFYTVSLQPAYIKSEKKSDETFHTENLPSKKSGAEDERNLPLNHIKQESLAQSIIEDVVRSSVQGEKFNQITGSRPNPELTTLAREYVSYVARESVSLKEENMQKEKRIYPEQLTSSTGFKEHEERVERDTYRDQDLQSTTCSCNVVKKESFEVGYSNFVSGSPSSSSKSSVMKKGNPASEDNPSVEYVSISRSPTITISEVDNVAEISVQDKKVENYIHGDQMDLQTTTCSCNATKQTGPMIKTDKSPVNVQTAEENVMTGIVREMKAYNDSNVDSSPYPGDDTLFDSESDFCKKRVHACREAKQTYSVSKEVSEIPGSGMAYYLIPVPQVQRTEYSFSEKEECCDPSKQAVHVAKEGRSAGAFESKAISASEIKKEEISLPSGEVNGTDGGNMYNAMDSSQYAEGDESFETESSFNKKHMCACREAKKGSSLSQEELELPACGMTYFLIPVSQVQGTEFNFPGQDEMIYGDKVSSETNGKLIYSDKSPVNVTREEAKIKAGRSTVRKMKGYDDNNMNSNQYVDDDISFDSESDCRNLRFHACREAPVTDDIYFDGHEESFDRDENNHREESEKLVRSFDVERKFYKEQMDAAIRKLNDQIKEIENLRTERDSLKTDLSTAQHYIEQHKQALNKLNSMRKVDEQLSRENEVLLKKVYQLSNTAFNQQTAISKLKTKLKQKSKHCNYIQNSSSSGKGSGELKPVHILFPTRENNLMVPHKSVFLESYSQYPLKNSGSDATSRYSNMVGDDNYSFNHINAKSAFVEHTVNHVEITAITGHKPLSKKYLDLKRTIRREKDDLLKVTKLIQFQQGIISNLSNCIDNEKMLLSELNSVRKERK